MKVDTLPEMLAHRNGSLEGGEAWRMIRPHQLGLIYTLTGVQ